MICQRKKFASLKLKTQLEQKIQGGIYHRSTDDALSTKCSTTQKYTQKRQPDRNVSKENA